MNDKHHFLCKVSILQQHSPQTQIRDDQCDCEFIIETLEKERNSV